MRITYHVARHDEGWAYRLGDVWSETFPDHDQALEAAKIAAQRQQLEGRDVEISYQKPDGQWQSEIAKGDDRPETEVTDDTQNDEAPSV